MAYRQSQLNRNEKIILRTLSYSDIFDFPLTTDELWQFLFTDKPPSRDVFLESLQNLCRTGSILQKGEYFCLEGRSAIITKRKENLGEVNKKFLIAKRAAYYLSYIPTIQFIGISGGLAVANVTASDDIDFFIITKKKTLFMTRLWILALLEVLGLRRAKNEKDPANKICVNLLVEETALAWPAVKRDLFIAHEIIQMKPLFERNAMYHKFLLANDWIREFFKNFSQQENAMPGKAWDREYYSLRIIGVLFSLPLCEYLLAVFQKLLIRRTRTSELISKSMLAFHPNDYRAKTLKRLNIKYRELGLLTNN